MATQTNVLEGKLTGVWLDIGNGLEYFRCQTDAQLQLTASTTENDACKPDQTSGAENVGLTWVTRTVDSKDWQITFSAKAFLDSLGANQFALIEFFISSPTLEVEAEFATNANTGAHSHPVDNFYTGTGLLTGVTLNGPQSGDSTYDATIDGNGPLVPESVPHTT
jgi:hypothetical protein